MPPRHHVLLIGIDAYDGGGMLTGCVNDIDAVQRLLVDRVGVRREHIRRLAAPRTDASHESDVPEELPTLDNLRAALTELGGEDVGPDDRVFVYYSGHGTQTVVAAGDSRRFSSEALLPKDKKHGAEYRLLFDWELNALAARIAARTPLVTVVLDCCSSAGATRGAGGPTGAQDRFWPTPEVYPLPVGEAPPNQSIRGVAAELSAVQRCQVVAACRDDQRARESTAEGGLANGELTRALVTRLAEVPDEELMDLRWGRIWRDVDAAVRVTNPRQSPWLSGSFGRRIFGFGQEDETDAGFAIVETASGFHLDAGTLAGVTTGAEIAVYGSAPAAFPALGSPEDLAARTGGIRVTQASPADSEAVAVEPFVLPEAPRGRLVRAGQAARLRVALAPEDVGLAGALAPSDLIALVGEAEAELTLARRADGAWALTDDVHGAGETDTEPALPVIPAARLDVARAAVEHYLAYVTPLRMAHACSDLPGMLRLWLLDCGDATISPAVAQDPDLPQVEAGTLAPYELTVGRRICFVVGNAAEVPLTVALIDCAASGRVLLLGEKRLPKRSKHVFWFQDTLGQPFAPSLPEGVSIGIDRIVAIATTRSDVSLRYLERRQSFADVMAPVRTRGMDSRSAARAVEAPVESWTSAVTAVRITR
jgi:Caspase domain